MKMESPEGKVCLNSKCRTSSSASWQLGWCLHSGLCAELCESCGLAFGESRFCEMFHLEDSGWRTCTMCGKRVHCGCIVSIGSYVLLDTGGVACTNCTSEGLLLLQDRLNMTHKGAAAMLLPPEIVLEKMGSEFHEIVTGVDKSTENVEVVRRHSKGLQLVRAVQSVDANTQVALSGDLKEALMPISCEAGFIGGAERRSQMPALLCTSPDKAVTELRVDISQDTTSQNGKNKDVVNEINKRTVALESMAVHSTVPADNENFGGTLGSKRSAVLGKARDVQELRPIISGASPLRLWQPQFTPPISTSGPPLRKEVVMRLERANESNTRVGRANEEGKVRIQLLPRYMPRISNQEMRQIISKDKNAIITPLFEKTLSASDTGRIGRLVLPKACAEAYFPQISLPEGKSLDIQDSTGKKWTFQFRYWPNNNSRMYVLEGVTPYIQHIGLQAGDTVTFSRLDPEGKLVMGYRKASASLLQDPSTNLTTSRNCTTADNGHAIPLSTTSRKGFVGSLSNQSNFLKSGNGSNKYGKPFISSKETAIIHSVPVADKKRGHPLGSKSKRLRIDNDDVLELKTTWEEAQKLLRPPPGATPSIVTIDGHEFEEYEVPPVLCRKATFRKVNSSTTSITPQEFRESELYQLSTFTDSEEM